jgi:hypothetical protein
MQKLPNVTTFKLKVRFEGETIPAQCQVIETHIHPQYRVPLVTESGKETVFVLYKTNQANKLFFWFPLIGQKELLAQAIARSLEKGIKS